MPRTLTAHAQIEILAPPSVVRSVFLDFARYNEWHQGWDIKLVDSTKKPVDLQTDDYLKVNMHGMPMTPRVAQNTPECFTWDGGVWGILSASHDFVFAPSEENPGGTTFIQKEDFQGPMTWLVPRSIAEGKGPSKNWVTFNEALKKKAETLSADN